MIRVNAIVDPEILAQRRGIEEPRLNASCRCRARSSTAAAATDLFAGSPTPAKTPVIDVLVRVATVAILLAALVAGQSPALPTPLPPPRDDLPVSLERIRAAIDKPEAHALEIDVPLPVPVARFETSVEVRRFMLSFEEQLHKDLEPTLLLRQSRDWASGCCGIDLNLLLGPIDRALQERKRRKIREQIARELDALKAARDK